MNDHLQQYVQYIRNAGSAVMSIVDFDDDWSPVGPMIRKQMMDAGLTEEWGGGLGLTIAAAPAALPVGIGEES